MIMEEQTYFVRVNCRDPFSKVIYDVALEADNVSKDVVLSIFLKHPINDGYSWQLWDNVKDDWISPEQFLEDNL